MYYQYPHIASGTWIQTPGLGAFTDLPRMSPLLRGFETLTSNSLTLDLWNLVILCTLQMLLNYMSCFDCLSSRSPTPPESSVALL